MRRFDPSKWAVDRKNAMENAQKLKAHRDTRGMRLAQAGVERESKEVSSNSNVPAPSVGLAESWDWTDPQSQQPEGSAKPSQVQIIAELAELSPTTKLREAYKARMDRRRARSEAADLIEELPAPPGPRSSDQHVRSIKIRAASSAANAPIVPTRQSSTEAVESDKIRTMHKTQAQAASSALNTAKIIQNPRAGQGDSDPVTRQMLDKNTLRLAARDTFMAALDLWRSGFGPQPEQANLSLKTGPSGSSSQTAVRVYVRKRPIFDREVSAKREFDIITARSDLLALHNCLFHADLRRPFIQHSFFTCFDRVFDDQASNLDVYEQSCCRDFTLHVASGGLAALFMFGSTGSGKSFTFTGLEGQVAKDLFEGIPEQSVVTVGFFEVKGRHAFDLLADSAEAVEIKLRELPDGSMHSEQQVEMIAQDSRELMKILERAHSRRSTKATGSNDESSRSHAVCTIKVTRPASSRLPVGKFLLVDCAGSERRKDSAHHDKERRREGAEINSSLHALKECMRWRAEVDARPDSRPTSAVPFRGSLLTRILAEAFVKPGSQLAVIATISPCATDVEHTMSTLKVVQFLSGRSSAAVAKQTELFPREEKPVRIPPGKWSPEQAAEWVHKISGGRIEVVKGTTGMMLVRMTEARFIQLCNGEESLGRYMYRVLHDLIKDPELGGSGGPPGGNAKVTRPASASQPSTAGSVKSIAGR